MQEKRLVEICQERFREGKRLVAPLMGFPGVEMVGSNIKLAQQNHYEHYKAIKALAERFAPDILFPLMDLSVEANAIGRYTIFPRSESATVPKNPFSIDELRQYREVNIGADARLCSYVETMKLMHVGLPKGVLRGAYVTGPYSLAALIAGADEAAMYTITDMELLHQVCEFATECIQEYIRLLISAGAGIICILEPSAVMLGPEHFNEFSGRYVRHLVQSFRFNRVHLIYHICGKSMHLLDNMVAAEVEGISLDAPDSGVDILEALRRVPQDIAIMGNIAPATTMLLEKPDRVYAKTMSLLQDTDAYPNFILSMGCDLPRETPLKNIDAFMRAGRHFKAPSMEPGAY